MHLWTDSKVQIINKIFRCKIANIFLSISQTNFLDAQKNCLIEMIFLSTHTICFGWETILVFSKAGTEFWWSYVHSSLIMFNMVYYYSWMEACINEELPQTTELEEGLRNGVYLAKLAHFMAPQKVPLKKIYDKEQARFKVSKASYTVPLLHSYT